MIPGNARILTCPHCGAKKEVLSLVSGNTFRQIVWSDKKTFAPMLPKVSPVQKCPECGKYYFLSRQKKEKYASKPSFNCGELSYCELKEAREQFSTMPDLTDDEKLTVLLCLVWAFNDEYTREVKKEIPNAEHEYISSVVEEMIRFDNLDDLLKAELLREIGRFDDAIKILDSYIPDNDFHRDLMVEFNYEAHQHNTLPFII